MREGSSFTEPFQLPAPATDTVQVHVGGWWGVVGRLVGRVVDTARTYRISGGCVSADPVALSAPCFIIASTGTGNNGFHRSVIVPFSSVLEPNVLNT